MGTGTNRTGPRRRSDDSLAEPAPHKTRQAARQHLSAAAKRRGWALAFVSMEGKSLVFQVRVDG